MIILLVVSGGLAGGIFLRSFAVFGWPPYVFALLLALIGAAAWRVAGRKEYLLFVLFLACAVLGAWRFSIAEKPLPPSFLAQVGQRVQFEGIVASDPDVREANQRVIIDVEQGGEKTRVLAVASRYSKVGVGDKVEVSGTLALPEPFSTDTDGGRMFRYDKFLEKDGIRFLSDFASVAVIDPAPWYHPSALLANTKHAFIDGLGRAIPEPYATLAAGLIVGGKQGLGKELLEAFILSGLVPIVVLSGYNVMIVAEGIMRALKTMRVPSRASAIAGAVAVLLFVLMAGAGSASIRAGLMALIALYARATGRSYAAGRALIVVAILMVLWNPYLLAFDPGFGLSIAATAGLIWLSPLIELRLIWIASDFCRSMLATTLAAQAAVLPLLLYETGMLSLVAIPANLVVLPMIPLAMAASAVAAVSGMFLGVLAPVFAFPAYLLNAYIVEVARFSSGLPLAALHIPPFPLWLMVLAYAVLILFARYICKAPVGVYARGALSAP
ncbi:MAG: ComEC/Rec2 family competence protein [bacterium]